jgi:hypothetical protein
MLGLKISFNPFPFVAQDSLSRLPARDRAIVDRYQASLPEMQPSRKTALTQVLVIKADLARAYFELGMTYRAVGNLRKSQESLQQVDRLLNELETVRKIEEALSHVA